MNNSRAWLVAILISLPVVTTGSNYRLMRTLVGAGQWPAPNSLLAAPAGAATVSVSDLAVGSVISVGGMNYVKINSNNVLAAASSFACPDGQWIAGKYVRCYDKNWDDLTITSSDVQVYGCQNPSGLMQTWNGCNSLATPAVGAYTQGPCLVDARDGKTYEIRKYADGKCWMVDNLAYGGDTALGGKDGCVAHPHMGVTFGANTSIVHDYEWDTSGIGKSSNFGQGYILRGTFGEGTYGSCAPAYDGTTYKAFETFQINGYSLANPHEYDTYQTALAAVKTANPTLTDSQANDLVRPRGYHYDWVATTQNPTAYYGGTYDATQGPTSGICPDGWRLPTGGSGGEWRQILTALKGVRRNLSIYWLSPTSGVASRTNSGLSRLTEICHFWAGTNSTANNANAIAYDDGAVYSETAGEKDSGFSVRCLKD